ncbi:MAG TPA: formimidoylglutamase [Rheinheimera sp.]|nr:formimidoylglutamase [Rheinheimera sp.]
MMLQVYTQADIASLVSVRNGESRIGQSICLPEPNHTLQRQLETARQHGCRYVLLGVPEDIGPRANLGQGGADKGWQAFLAKFLNLQVNQFIDAKQLLLLGHIYCEDIQQKSAVLNASIPEQLIDLRELVATLDQRVEAVANLIFAAGLLPIVIGGGHNNSLPLLQALAGSSGQKANSANLDPHSDFRPLEGRHSGNGFSYAYQAGYLEHYFVLALHELKNSAATLQQLHDANAEFCSYQRIFVRQEVDFQQALDLCIEHVIKGTGDIGIELDTDSISMMPVSAFTNCGISVQAAEQFVYQLAKLPRSKYLHLAEAAPIQHPAGLAAGLNEAGQVLSALVVAFIQGKQHQAALV